MNVEVFYSDTWKRQLYVMVNWLAVIGSKEGDLNSFN